MEGYNYYLILILGKSHMKKWRTIFLTNGIGLAFLLVCLFGSQYFPEYFKQVREVQNHQTLAINRHKLKENLEFCTDERLLSMYEAGQEIMEWNRVLEKTDSHVIKELLKGQGVFYGMEHYPNHDSYDQETYAQYYYHAHRKGEHGHFHLFLRQGGMPEGVLPCFYDERNDTMSDSDTFAHIVAIAMDDEGYPIKLFTTNRWVTGEDWYRCDDVCRMIERFKIEHTHPSWIVNKWLSCMLSLFYPQIAQLIHDREQVLLENSEGKSLLEAMEDTNLDVLSEVEISISDQMSVLEELMKERRIHSPLFEVNMSCRKTLGGQGS